MPQELLEALRADKLAYTKAKALAKIKDDALRTEFLEQTIAEGWSQREIRQRLKDKLSSLASTEEEDSLAPTPQSRLHALTHRLKKVKL